MKGREVRRLVRQRGLLRLGLVLVLDERAQATRPRYFRAASNGEWPVDEAVDKPLLCG